ncbi:hypothetical protein [Tunturiibacter gelidiferens]|uniref:Uncharacterized protein n=1 Tax=Tunturiibacter gelidiferens TaxID=3069689 RepID=A0AAU7YUC2_9BACT
MYITTHYAKNIANAIANLALYSALALSPLAAVGQMPMPSAQPAPAQTRADAAVQPQDTQAQITQLKQQVAQLQVALQQSRVKKTNPSKSTMNSANPAMGKGDDSGEMGGISSGAATPPMAPMKDDSGEMSAMAPTGGAMKSGDAKPMRGSGCCGMSMGKPMPKAGGMAGDKMGGMSGGSMPSKNAKDMSGATTTEASPLLHVGAKDFFLDHAKHLNLTPDQKMSLEMIKSSALKHQSTTEMQVAQAQQELWQLTSAEQPVSAQIDGKVWEIAKLNADEQIAFIHSVSASSAVLTADQQAEAIKSMSSPMNPKSKMQKSAETAPMKME